MKSLKMITLMMLLLMIAASAYAEGCESTCTADASSVSVSGQLRYRINTDGFDFDSDTPLNFFSEMRTRVNVKAKAGENAGVFFQAQDSRNIADFPGWDFSNQNMSMQQGYLWYAPCDKGWLKMGRMAVGLHNERLISKVDWDNTGRVFEGLMLGRKLGDNLDLTAFAFQGDENYDQFYDDSFPPVLLSDPNDPWGDAMVYGLNFNLPQQQVDLFGYMVREQASGDYSLMTFGAFSKREFAASLWYEAMFAMQTGSDDAIDYSGMLFNAQVGKVFDSGMYLGVLVDYTTGDDATTADKYEGFNNLFSNYHSFNGFMDLVAGGGNHGLMDLGLRAKYPLNDSWKFKGDFHMFSNVEDRADGETAIGNEIDLTAVYTDGAFNWTTGFSMFSVDEKYMAGADSQNWFYTMTSVDF